MKPLFLLFVATLFFSGTGLAQDNLILRSGEEIKAKVLEVSSMEIKYKKADNPQGPLYVISKSEVFIIQYENGTRDVISRAEGAPSSAKYPVRKAETAAAGNYDKMRHLARKRIAGGAVMIAAGAPILIAGVTMTAHAVNRMNRLYPNQAPDAHEGNGSTLAAGFLCIAGGIVLEVLGPITLKKGLRYRRQANEAKASLGFTPIVNPGLDHYNTVLNNTNIGSLTFNF